MVTLNQSSTSTEYNKFRQTTRQLYLLRTCRGKSRPFGSWHKFPVPKQTEENGEYSEVRPYKKKHIEGTEEIII